MLSWRARRFYSAVRGQQGLDLREWVEKEGGFVSQWLRIDGDGQCGLGLLATRRLLRGETVVSLPSHLPMSLPSASDPALPPPDVTLLSIVQRVPEELWSLRLGLKLLSEKSKESSFWWPYISGLPQRFQLPIFFSGDDISNLQYPPVVHQVKKRCQFLAHLSLKEIPAMLKNLSEDRQPYGDQNVEMGALGWAMSAVSSRAFRVQNTARTTTRMLLPLIDMCNHSFSPNARLVQIPATDNGDFVLKVVVESSLEEGMPLSLDYGPLSNDLLLLDYGFIVANNPHDRLELKFDTTLLDVARLAGGLSSQGLPSFLCPAPWQEALLTQLCLHGPDASLLVRLGGPEIVDGRLLAALRILYASDACQLHQHDLDQLQQWGSQPPLGFVNERNVLRTLAALSAVILTRSFPTSVGEDMALLEDAQLSASRGLVIEYRLTKKQLLLDVIDRLKQRLKSLKPEAKLERPTR